MRVAAAQGCGTGTSSGQRPRPGKERSGDHPNNISDSADPSTSDESALEAEPPARPRPTPSPTRIGRSSRARTPVPALDIIAKRRTWYTRHADHDRRLRPVDSQCGFTFGGIDFEGGTQIAVRPPLRSPATPSKPYRTPSAKNRTACSPRAAVPAATIQLRPEHLTRDHRPITTALADRFSSSITADDVSSSDVSPPGVGRSPRRC